MAWLQENGLTVLLLVVFAAFMLRWPVMARLTGVEQLTVHDLSAQMGTATPPLLLDVRSQAEYDSGHVPNAVLMPISDLSDNLDSLKKQGLSRHVAVICLSGSRSVHGAVLLKQAGFEKVYNVVGGTANWKAQGYPVR